MSFFCNKFFPPSCKDGTIVETINTVRRRCLEILSQQRQFGSALTNVLIVAIVMSRNSAWTAIRSAMLSLATVAVGATGLFADERTGPARADEIWLVSARDCDCATEPGLSLLRCERFCEGRWIETCCNELCSNKSGINMETVVFVHGYLTDLQGARQMGQEVYENVFSGRCETAPVRFIIWAWKSERETRRPIQDFAIMSRRANSLGEIFALTLNQLGPRPPVVIAYSLGTQVVLSALAQSTLYQGPPIQLVAIAAATDCGFASNCQQMSNCGDIARSVVFLNNGDRAIRAAKLACRVTYGHSFKTFESLAPMHPDQLGQIEIIDITSVASRRHSIMLYTEIPIVQSSIRALVAQNFSSCNSATNDPGRPGALVVKFQTARLTSNARAPNDVCSIR